MLLALTQQQKIEHKHSIMETFLAFNLYVVKQEEMWIIFLTGLTVYIFICQAEKHIAKSIQQAGQGQQLRVLPDFYVRLADKQAFKASPAASNGLCLGDGGSEAK